MANNHKAGTIDQSELPPNTHRGRICRLQENDQTHPTTVGDQINTCFKVLIQKALTMIQVDQIDFDNEGNLLQYAVKMNHKGYLQILIDYGCAFFIMLICSLLTSAY